MAKATTYIICPQYIKLYGTTRLARLWPKQQWDHILYHPWILMIPTFTVFNSLWRYRSCIGPQLSEVVMGPWVLIAVRSSTKIIKRCMMWQDILACCGQIIVVTCLSCEHYWCIIQIRLIDMKWPWTIYNNGLSLTGWADSNWLSCWSSDTVTLWSSFCPWPPGAANGKLELYTTNVPFRPFLAQHRF